MTIDDLDELYALREQILQSGCKLAKLVYIKSILKSIILRSLVVKYVFVGKIKLWCADSGSGLSFYLSRQVFLRY